ncbi:MAG: hypothetical protein ACFWTJ_05425 [Lachnoclostridium sp.]|jgi:c-di-AMP phosphodiesterase-like protein
MKNNLLKTFVSSIAFGICYALITFIFNHEIDLRLILITTIFYFIFMNLLHFITTKIRNITGHDN